MLLRHIFLTLLLAASLPALAQPEQASELSAAHPDDPWEGYNRAMFDFNNVVDHFTFKPLAKGYQWLLPDPVETGIDNVFLNLREITNVFNDILQWRWDQAAHDTGRFLINSTVGIGGVFDVAGHFGLARSDGEDFGQTLAVWGVGQGPYLMLPLLGPSTLRRTVAIPLDLDSLPIAQIPDNDVRNGVLFVRFIALRAQLLPFEKTITGDPYVFVRSAYLQNRQFLINNGVVQDDDFGDDSDEYGDY